MKIVQICLAMVLSVSVLAGDDPLKRAVEGANRTPANLERDKYRHPYDTLEFFQLEQGQVVVEIWPGGGWYTEILAPYLKEGTFYAAHFAVDTDLEYFQKSRAKFIEKMSADPASYGNAKVVDFDPTKSRLQVPDGSADRVYTFRNVHNWLFKDSEQVAFDLFFKALKPGGMLGVVEHRAKPDTPRETMKRSGYMTEFAVIKTAEAAGFELVKKSEMNANSKDTTDYPNGVWTLPPRLRVEDELKEKYKAIGESDRMTLLFRKPAE